MAKCPECNGSGFILKKDKYDEDVWSPCECRKKREAEVSTEIKFTEANIRKSLRRYTFEDYLKYPFKRKDKLHNAPQIKEFQNYLENPSDFLDNYSVLWIWGTDANAGHTTLASILGIKLLEFGYKVRFLEIQHLIEAFTKFDEKEVFFTELKKFDIYIINDAFDVDRGHVGGKYSQVHLYQFINDALIDGKHFIMTSNRLVRDIDKGDLKDFEQSKIIISRSVKQLEFRGSID